MHTRIVFLVIYGFYPNKGDLGVLLRGVCTWLEDSEPSRTPVLRSRPPRPGSMIQGQHRFYSLPSVDIRAEDTL